MEGMFCLFFRMGNKSLRLVLRPLLMSTHSQHRDGMGEQSSGRSNEAT